MAAARTNLAALAFLLVLATSAVGKTSAATYVVGDSTGWRIPSGGAAFYVSWAAGKKFHVGDHLVFNFTTGTHDLAIVSKASYDGCSSSNPISLVTVGPSTVKLTSPGEAYFMCTFSGHCGAGQKLAINVTSASPTTPTPAPTPSSSPPPAPTPSPTATPPSPSTAPPTPTPTPAPTTPVPVPAPGPGTTAPTPGPGTPAPTPGPGTSVPSPAPGPAGEAPNTGGPSPGSSPSPGPGGSGGEGQTPPPPPPSAAPASAPILVITVMSFALGIFLF